MEIGRRAALRYAGTAGIVSLGGCLDGTRVDAEVFQLGGSQSTPLWDSPEADRVGYVTVLTDDDELWMVEDPESIDSFESWYAETDFEQSVLLYVASVGLNDCYTELDIGDIDREDDRLTGTARAIDTSTDEQACAEVITYPAAFVRVTGEDLPTEAAFEITTGWDDTETVTTDDPLLDPSRLPGSIRPDGDPESMPDELSCDDDDFERHANWVDEDNVRWGDIEDDGESTFALRVGNPQADADADKDSDPPGFERGDESRITLTNVSERIIETGNRHKYGLQVRTAAGWQDVRGWVDGRSVGYTDEAIVHEPGTAFEWTLRLTEKGVIADHTAEEHLTVCPGLPTGRYRFVYWGLIGDEAIAVAFDYRD